MIVTLPSTESAEWALELLQVRLLTLLVALSCLCPDPTLSVRSLFFLLFFSFSATRGLDLHIRRLVLCSCVTRLGSRHRSRAMPTSSYQEKPSSRRVPATHNPPASLLDWCGVGGLQPESLHNRKLLEAMSNLGMVRKCLALGDQKVERLTFATSLKLYLPPHSESVFFASPAQSIVLPFVR